MIKKGRAVLLIKNVTPKEKETKDQWQKTDAAYPFDWSWIAIYLLQNLRKNVQFKIYNFFKVWWAMFYFVSLIVSTNIKKSFCILFVSTSKYQLQIVSFVVLWAFLTITISCEISYFILIFGSSTAEFPSISFASVYILYQICKCSKKMSQNKLVIPVLNEKVSFMFFQLLYSIVITRIICFPHMYLLQ